MAQDPVTLFLSIDKTGNNLDNKVIDEIHIVKELENIIKPNMTAFYASSMIVKAIDSNDDEVLLIENVDYKLGNFFERATADIGKEICGSIIFIRTIVERKFSLTYQAVGGDRYGNNKPIAGFISENSDNNIVNWEDILNKPIGFTPTPGHPHEWRDIYGADYLVNTLNDLAQSITDSKNIYDLGIVDKLKKCFTENKINLTSLFSNTALLRNLRNLLLGITSQSKFLTTFIREYNAFNFSKESSIILSFIINDKYSNFQNYEDIYNVPEKIDGLDLWIDFSDVSKLDINVNNKINSITDKSSNARVFSQTDENKKPISIDNPDYGIGKIRKNKSSNFLSGCNLVQTSGTPININNKFTLVILARIKNSPGDILSKNNNSDKIVINDDQFRVINVNTNKYKIKSTPVTTTNNEYLLNFLSVGNKDESIIWNINNFGNEGQNYYGLTEFENNISISNLVFDTIGNFSVAFQDYELCEILLFNRQLSLIESIAIKDYISRKWSGTEDLDITMTLPTLNDVGPIPDSFWLYTNSNTP